jgi:CheY-like chemotaxis protein
MPVMDGLEAARELKWAYARGPDIDVYIVHKRESSRGGSRGRRAQSGVETQPARSARQGFADALSSCGLDLSAHAEYPLINRNLQC